MYPEVIEHGMKEEENPQFYYSKVNSKSFVHLILRGQASLSAAVILENVSVKKIFSR